MTEKPKLITDDIREELKPELDELAERMYQKGLRDAASGGSATASAVRSADALAKRARQLQASAASLGLPLTNEEAVKQAYVEAGASLE